MKWRPWSVTCDVCGFELDADEVKQRWDGFIVCDKDFEYRHEQDFLRAGRNPRPLPFTRANRDGEVDVTPIYYDHMFDMDSQEDGDTFSGQMIGGPELAIWTTEEADVFAGNINGNVQLLATESTDTSAITVEIRDVSLVAVETGDTTNATFNVKGNFTLENPTDAGSHTITSYTDGEIVTPSTALSPTSTGQWGGIGYYKDFFGDYQNITWTQTLAYYGSPNTTGSASGIYWRWQRFASAPNYTNMLEATWYPVGDNNYYVGMILTSDTPSSAACVVSIQFAYDASGTGATTAGLWTITSDIDSLP